MTLALLIGRIGLACVFAVAGLAKLADREGSRRAARGFGVPARLVPAVAIVLPLIELVVAGALLPGASARLAAAAAAGLLALFTIAIAVALARGQRPDCHCFGQLHGAAAGPVTLARNGALAAVAVVIAAQPAATPTWLELAVFGVAALVAAQALISWRLLRRYGRALRRIEELEAGSSHAPTLGVGVEAPEFALPRVGGGEVTLRGLLARARPVLLVFADADCPPCRALLPDLAGWQREFAERLTVVLVSQGDRSENAALAEEHALDHVLLQETREVAELYGAAATPSAVLIGADGRIVRAFAMGAAAIAELVDSATAPDRTREVSPNGGARVAVAAAVAGAAAATTAVATASPRAAEAAPDLTDPALQAIDAALKVASPRLLAAAQRSRKAVRAQATLRVGAAQRERRAAARRALAAERREVLALRSKLAKMTIDARTSRTAYNARYFAVSSLDSLAKSLQKRERAIGATPTVALPLISQAQRLFLQSIASGANAGKLLGRG